MTAIVASIAAGIGEETLFRLFFISFWTWLVARLLLRGRWQTPVYWAVSTMSALAFAMAHLPALMFFHGWTEFSQIPSLLLVEIVLLNGLLGMFAAWAFKKYGFLAPSWPALLDGYCLACALGLVLGGTHEHIKIASVENKR